MTDASGRGVSLDFLQQQNQTLLQEVKRLKTGGGGGTSDGMDVRVSRLESQVDKLDAHVTDMKVSLATLTERVAHLPSKGFIVTALGTTATVLGAIVLLADRLKSLLG